RYARARSARLHPRPQPLVTSRAGSAGARRARREHRRIPLGDGQRWRRHGERAAATGEPRAGRGPDPRRDPPHPRRRYHRRRASTRHYRGGGGARIRDETADGRARALGLAETIWTLEDELAYLTRIRSVTTTQVRAVARRYLDLERYTRLALLPPAR